MGEAKRKRQAAAAGGTLGSGPIQDEYIRMMNSLAGILDHAFNGDAKGADRKTGFVLMVFPFDGEPGRCNYISNAERADVKTLLKEPLAYFEGQSDKERGHA